MSIQYRAIITHQQDDRFFVQFPAMNEAFTEGETLSEALLNAQEVLNLSLDGRLEDGLEIPPPDMEKLGEPEYLITPDASIQSALLIHFYRGNQSLTELAAVLGIPAQDIENPKNNITIFGLEQIARAMGKHLVIDFA
ncbi:MAG: type II toxin-antitoxin system HicB family antitoxin [Candidatus Parabeggiatoa sp. nov. 1]|nr:MAG: type II toxin-antitoxin system HicB family antitoxin [Gammaproteobacteria bacterium]